MDKRERLARLELHRIAVAARDIECARQGFELLLELDSEPADKKYQPILFGAVASYGRPFTSNDGFGSLPGRWQRFDSDGLSSAHREILEYRNSVVAHSDIRKNRLLIYPTGCSLTVGEETMVLDEPMYAVATPLLNKSDIPRYIELCDYQHRRMLSMTIDGVSSRFMRNKSIPPQPFEFHHEQSET